MFVIRLTNGRDHYILGPFMSSEEALEWKDENIGKLYQNLQLCVVHQVINPEEIFSEEVH